MDASNVELDAFEEMPPSVRMVLGRSDEGSPTLDSEPSGRPVGDDWPR